MTAYSKQAPFSQSRHLPWPIELASSVGWMEAEHDLIPKAPVPNLLT